MNDDAKWREPLETLLALFTEYECDWEAQVVRDVLALESAEEAANQVATMTFWGGMGSLLDVALSARTKGKSENQICDDEIAQALAFWDMAQWLKKIRGDGLWTSRGHLMENIVRYWQNRRTP